MSKADIEAPNWADWVSLGFSFLATFPASLAAVMQDAALLCHLYSERIDKRKEFARAAARSIESIVEGGGSR